MSIELKIKAKHLAIEPAIIRHEERKLLKQIRWLRAHQRNTEADILYYKWYELYSHRKIDVAREARATHLARAFIAGKPFKTVENKDNMSVAKYSDLYGHILGRITNMVAKYGKNKLIKQYYKVPGKMDYNPEEYEALRKEILRWIDADC